MAPEKYNGLVRVNFSTRGFAKLITRDALSPLTPNPEALVGVGQVLGAAKLNEESAPTFLSIPEFRGIDYVGYIVDKERLDRNSGTWKRLSEFHIIGAKSNSFKDSRVAYGETYRYRIRGIVKWTTYNNPDVTNNNQQTVNLLASVQNAITTALNVNAQALQYSTAGLSAKSSTSSAVTVGPASVDPSGVGNWFAFNIQAPTSTSRLKTLNDSVTSLLSAIGSNTATPDTIARMTNQLIASGVVLSSVPQKVYTSEYLASYPSRNWKYVTIAEQVLPDPPSAIKIVPCTPMRSIAVYWLPPTDAQRDLSFMRLYRRNALGEPWQILRDNIKLTDSHHIDADLVLDKKYIYALSAVDLHGYESFLSTQIQAQLNPSFNAEKQEKLLRWVSGAGARPDETNTIFKRFYDPFEQLIAKQSLTISPSDTLSDANTTIILRVKSLDTHETRDIKVNLRNISKT